MSEIKKQARQRLEAEAAQKRERLALGLTVAQHKRYLSLLSQTDYSPRAVALALDYAKGE